MSSKILSHSALNAAVGMAQLGSGFVCSIIVARLLGAEAVGVIAFSLWMVTTAMALADLGISIALRRFVPDVQAAGGEPAANVQRFGAFLVKPYLGSVAVLSVLHLVLWFSGAYRGISFEGGNTILLTGIVFIVYAGGAFTVSLLIGAKDYGPLVRMTLQSAPLQIACVTVGALLFGVNGALLGYIPAYLLFFIAALGLLFRKGHDFGLGARRLMEYSLVSWLAYTVQIIFLYRAEFFFLGTYTSHEAVGLYSAAMSLANIALQLPLQAAGALIPFFSEQRYDLSSNTPPEGLQASMRAMFLLALPMCFGLAAIAPELMPAIFGEPFRAAAGLLEILAATSPVFIFFAFASQFFYATEQVRFALATCLVGAAVLTVGCILVVPVYGTVGAAVVRGVTYLVMAAIAFHRIHMARASASTWRMLLATFIAATLCAGTARGVLILVHGWGGIILAIAAGGLAYGLALKLLRALPPGDVDVLVAVTKRLPSPVGAAVRFLGNRPAPVRQEA